MSARRSRGEVRAQPPLRPARRPPPRRCSVRARFELEERKVPPPPRLPRAVRSAPPGGGRRVAAGPRSCQRPSCQGSADIKARFPGAVLGLGPALGSSRRPGNPAVREGCRNVLL